MRINHNLSAVVANNKLLQNEDVVSESMERLSSGLRINHAKDDPAGIAISNRMDTQIDGTSQASRNAKDGTSLIETAEGSLNEITSILQRMNELAVQAASDTYTTSDREAIQSEIDQLREEIDRLSRDTEFNTKTLLNGSLDQRVYSNKASDGTNLVSRIAISDYVSAGTYKMNVTSATKSQLTTGTSELADTSNDSAIVGTTGTISINGYSFEVEATDTNAELYLKLAQAAEKGEAAVEKDGDALQFTSTLYGKDHDIKIECSNTTLSQKLGLANNTSVSLSDNGNATATEGTDASLTIVDNETDSESFFKQASWKADGNKITIFENGGFEMSFYPSDACAGGADVELEVTTTGDLQIQIGANEGQTMNIRIPEVTSESLYIDGIDVSTVTGADRAITAFQDALQTVTDIRSKLGAYENRLDNATSSLDVAEENLTSALSRIRDVDMAEEMTTYTENSVLVQAATSVLAQANDLPQQVLELLR